MQDFKIFLSVLQQIWLETPVDAAHMPRQLTRTKSAEILSSGSFFGSRGKPARTHSLRHHGFRNWVRGLTDKNGAKTKAGTRLEGLHEPTLDDSPRSAQSGRSKFREGFEADRDGIQTEASHTPMLALPSLRSDSAEISRSFDELWPVQEEQECLPQSRDIGGESPYFSTPQRHASLGKTTMGKEGSTWATTAAPVFDASPRRVHQVDENGTDPAKDLPIREPSKMAGQRDHPGAPAKHLTGRKDRNTSRFSESALLPVPASPISQARRSSLMQDFLSSANPIKYRPIDSTPAIVETKPRPHSMGKGFRHTPHPLRANPTEQSSRDAEPSGGPLNGTEKASNTDLSADAVQSSKKSPHDTGKGKEPAAIPQGNPDIPSLPHRVVKMPSSKRWRNYHRNYFPPGASEMTQTRVIQIINDYRREVESARERRGEKGEKQIA